MRTRSGLDEAGLHPYGSSVRLRRQGASSAAWWRALRISGGALLVASGAIHLDLYLTGYRSIPTIGWLFLLQVISALGLGALVILSGNALFAAIGAVFVVSTLLGYLLSLRHALFGFREVRTTAGVASGIIEIAAFATLATIALVPELGPQQGRVAPARQTTGGVHPRWFRVGRWLGAAVAIQASVAFGLGVTSSDTSAARPPATVVLKARVVHGVSVLTDGRGYTLYWFAPDSSTRSTCYGVCAAYWPPVLGSASAGPGAVGTIGEVTRRNGSTQVTYDGHPLYGYVGDSAPGQASGNRVDLNGGWWYEVKAS